MNKTWRLVALCGGRASRLPSRGLGGDSDSQDSLRPAGSGLHLQQAAARRVHCREEDRPQGAAIAG
jgi:hypothetical protein